MTTQQTDFIENWPYLFTGDITLIQNYNRKDKLLGRFISYSISLYDGDYNPNAEAIFEFGSVKYGQYHNIIKIED